MNPTPQLANGLALIFDLDGVVVDSMPVHREAWRCYMERLGIGCNGISERMHGRRNDEIVRDFIGSDLTAAQIFDHGAAKEALFRELMDSQLDRSLVQGVVSFLEKYDAAPIGLATNAGPANVQFVLDRFSLGPYFDVVVDGHQVTRPKPHPEVYLRAAQLLNVPPQNCIVFEDSPAGVDAARASGARVVAVRTFDGELPGVDFEIDNFLSPALGTWLRTIQPQ